MQRMCRRFFAAVVGLVAVAGAASAQSPPPNYFPPVQAAPVTPASGTAVVQGQGGCSNCGSAANGYAVPYGSYGPRDRNGCGSLKADCGFIFGSCKSFFDPCGPVPCDGGGGKHAGKHGGLFGGRLGGCCGIQPFGSPYNNGGWNHCTYDSFLNH